MQVALKSYADNVRVVHNMLPTDMQTIHIPFLADNEGCTQSCFF